jgi:replicative DNA helicase
MDATHWEKALIGSVLYDQTMLPEDISPTDFAIKQHMEIWKQATDLASRQALSVRSLAEALRANDLLDSIGDSDHQGEAYLYELLELADITTIEEYVRQVKEASDKRKLEDIGRILVHDARNGKASTEIIDNNLRKLLKFKRSGIRDARRIGEGIDARITRMEKMRKGEIGMSWAPHPEAVKQIYGHADEADFIIVVAKPGSGKSSYLRYEAIETASDGDGVLTITLENTREEAQDWAIAKYTGINHARIKNPRLMSNQEWETYKETKIWIETLPWYIEDAGFSNISNIVALSRRMAITKEIRLIQIDGMYLVEQNGEGKYEVISDVAQGLRSLAQELKIPVMASTQFSRKVNVKKVPDLDDLLYAGENPARSIWAIVRKKLTQGEAALFDENKDSNGTLMDEANYGAQVFRFKILKNTGGQTGWSGEIVWRKSTNEFQSLARGWNMKPGSYEMPTKPMVTQRTFNPASKPTREERK